MSPWHQVSTWIEGTRAVRQPFDVIPPPNHMQPVNHAPLAPHIFKGLKASHHRLHQLIPTGRGTRYIASNILHADPSEA